MHLAFDDLRTDDQAVAFEMISWVNRSNVDVLSVDIPSGMSASNGKYFLAPKAASRGSFYFLSPCLGINQRNKQET
jgi:enhancer of mRNA-decapping protein 3